MNNFQNIVDAVEFEMYTFRMGVKKNKMVEQVAHLQRINQMYFRLKDTAKLLGCAAQDVNDAIELLSYFFNSIDTTPNRAGIE